MLSGCLYTIFIRPFVIVGQLLWNLIQLIPYALVIGLIWFALNNSSLSNLGVDSFRSWTMLLGERLDQRSTNPPTTALHNRYPLDFRFRWQGEQIYYLGNQIEDRYFVQLAEEANQLGGKITVEQASDVEQALAERRLNVLTKLGVPHEVIIRG